MRAKSAMLQPPPRPPLSSRPSSNSVGSRSRKVITASAEPDTKARERLVIDAGSFLAEKAGGYAITVSPTRPETSSQEVVMKRPVGTTRIKKQKAPVVVDDKPVRVSKAEVRSARHLFGNILKTTETIIEAIKTEDAMCTALVLVDNSISSSSSPAPGAETSTTRTTNSTTVSV
jgi:hypothetical protein